MKIERQMYLDYLRIISIFCVIGIHVVAKNWYVVPTNKVTWHILNVYDSIFRFCVPIFIMISGALFLNKDKKIDTKTLFKKNILRIFIALVFWSLLYAVFKHILIYKSINVLVLKEILKSFLEGHHHLWFLTMFLGLYLIVPLLRKLCEDKKLEEYFIILSFILASLLPFLNELKIFNLIFDSTIFMIEVPFVMGYVGYYVLGHYLSSYDISKYKEFIIYILGSCALIFTIVITSLSSLRDLEPTITFYDYLFANTFIYSTMVFVLFKCRISKIKISNNLKNKIIKISDLVFGVYLCHELFIVVLEHFYILKPDFWYSVLSPLIAVIIFVLSIIISFTISKMPIIKKYII